MNIKRNNYGRDVQVEFKPTLRRTRTIVRVNRLGTIQGAW